MKKLLLALLFVWCLPIINVHGQAAGSGWILFSELSPTPRNGKNRVLPNAINNFNLEWRNRVGKMVNSQTAMGIIGSYRSYSHFEPLTFVLDQSFSSYSYDYKVRNDLWGAGAFMTRFIQIHPRVQLQATLFGLYESGSGNYNMVLQGFNCPSCFTSGINSNMRTGDIENLAFRERNIFGGLDLGISYSLNTRIGLLAGINLIQYENYFISDGNRISPSLSSSALYRQIDRQGDTFTSVFDRPILHLGMMIGIGK